MMQGEAKSSLKIQKVNARFVAPTPNKTARFSRLRASRGIASEAWKLNYNATTEGGFFERPIDFEYFWGNTWVDLKLNIEGAE